MSPVVHQTILQIWAWLCEAYIPVHVLGSNRWFSCWNHQTQENYYTPPIFFIITLDNSLLNMLIGLSIGWGIANCKSILIVTSNNRKVKMSIDTCFFHHKVQRNWYNRLLFLGWAYSISHLLSRVWSITQEWRREFLAYKNMSGFVHHLVLLLTPTHSVERPRDRSMWSRLRKEVQTLRAVCIGFLFLSLVVFFFREC